MYCEVAFGRRRERKEGGGGGRAAAAVWGKLRLSGWIETAKYICESGSRGKSWWHSAITVKRERRSCCCHVREGRGLSRRGRPIAD